MGTEQDRSQELLHQTYEPVADLIVGELHYFILENGEGRTKIEKVVPSADGAVYASYKSLLHPEHFHNLVGLSPNKVSLLDLGFTTVQVVWHQRMGKNPEPTFSFSATESVKGNKSTFEITEKEMMALFLPGVQGQDRRATFFTLDTKKNEIIGILLKRERPVLIFIQPGNELAQYTSQLGLAHLIEQVYRSFSTTQRSIFRRMIENAVLDQFKPGGKVELPVERDSSRQSLSPTYKRIYQIQTTLLALNAENSGRELSDPALLQFAPFLQPEIPKVGSRFGKLLSQRKDNQVYPTTIKLGPNSWNSLVENLDDQVFSSGDSEHPLIQEPTVSDLSNTLVPITEELPSLPISLAVAASTSVAEESIQNNSTETENRVEVRLSDKERALLASREIFVGLDFFPQQISDLDPNSLDLEFVKSSDDYLAELISLCEHYFDQFGIVRKTTNDFDVSVQSGGVELPVLRQSGQDVFNFITGNEEMLWYQKIEAAQTVWPRYVESVFINARDRFNRTIEALTWEVTDVPRWNNAFAEKLMSEFTKVFKDVSDWSSIDVGLTSHFFLLSQLIYCFEEQYQQLKRNEQIEEIHYWVYVLHSHLIGLRRSNLKIIDFLVEKG